MFLSESFGDFIPKQVYIPHNFPSTLAYFFHLLQFCIYFLSKFAIISIMLEKMPGIKGGESMTLLFNTFILGTAKFIVECSDLYFPQFAKPLQTWPWFLCPDINHRNLEWNSLWPIFQNWIVSEYWNLNPDVFDVENQLTTSRNKRKAMLLIGNLFSATSWQNFLYTSSFPALFNSPKTSGRQNLD